MIVLVERNSGKLSILRALKIIAVSFSIMTGGPAAAQAASCSEDLPPLKVFEQQKALVDALTKHLQGVKDEEKVGQRQVWEVLKAYEDYYEAVEVFDALEQCKAGEGKAAAAGRIKAASDRLDLFREFAKFAKQRWEVGEITQTDVALAEAYALKAAIRLRTLEAEGNQPEAPAGLIR